MSIANYLTLVRVFIAPLFLFTYLEHQLLGINEILLPYILLTLFGISELSDAFDGYLARKYNQVTDLGKVLDPMADSIARISVFMTFTLEPIKLPMILVFIFLYRDSVISTLRTMCALKGIALGARLSGKIKAIVQAIAALIVLMLMIPHSLGLITQQTLHDIGTAIVSIAAIYTVFSGIDYIYAYWHYIIKFLWEKQPSKG